MCLVLRTILHLGLSVLDKKTTFNRYAFGLKGWPLGNTSKCLKQPGLSLLVLAVLNFRAAACLVLPLVGSSLEESAAGQQAG